MHQPLIVFYRAIRVRNDSLSSAKSAAVSASSTQRHGLKHKLELKRAKHTTVSRRTKHSPVVKKSSAARGNEVEKETTSVREKHKSSANCSSDEQPSTSAGCANNSKSFPNGQGPSNGPSSNCEQKEEDLVVEDEHGQESIHEDLISVGSDGDYGDVGGEGEGHDNMAESLCNVSGQRSRIPVPIASSSLINKQVSLFSHIEFL